MHKLLNLLFLVLLFSCATDNDQLKTDLLKEFQDLQEEIDKQYSDLLADVDRLSGSAKSEAQDALKSIEKEKSELNKIILKTKIATWLELQEYKIELKKAEKSTRREIKRLKKHIERTRE